MTVMRALQATIKELEKQVEEERKLAAAAAETLDVPVATSPVATSDAEWDPAHDLATPLTWQNLGAAMLAMQKQTLFTMYETHFETPTLAGVSVLSLIHI